MEKRNRNLGLDIVRSIAILLVLICHSTFFLNNINGAFLTYCGVISVEIFFVLSGFLIGRIIITTIVKEYSLNSLKDFYIKRWFRTLPLYYLILFVTSIIKNQSIPHRNYVFIQNFNKHALGFLPVSWSLSVEEWFYLLIPIILVIFLKLFNNKFKEKEIFFMITILLCSISFLIRTYIVVKYNPTWDYGVRKQIFIRLDAIMIGVILSGIKIYMSKNYTKIALSRGSKLISIIGFILLGLIYTKYLGIDDNFDKSMFWKIGLFSLVPILSCFFIMWMEMSEKINITINKMKISRLFNEISTISYAIYLIHWNIFEQLSKHVKGFYGLLLALILTLIITKIINLIFEVPIMNLRDRITSKEKINKIEKLESIN